MKTQTYRVRPWSGIQLADDYTASNEMDTHNVGKPTLLGTNVTHEFRNPFVHEFPPPPRTSLDSFWANKYKNLRQQKELDAATLTLHAVD